MDVSVLPRIADVPAADWDALAGDDNPFVEHAFLHALEESKSVGPRTGWLPQHLVVKEGGALVAALPCYVKTDSYGEYIFDWQWARAAGRARVDYYPKLTAAVPFTPATGPRLLVKPGAPVERARKALAEGMKLLEKELGCSSSHVLFCRDDEAASLVDNGFGRRASLQYHWRNGGYDSFDGFLAALRHEERKQIKRERRRVAESGVDVEVMNGADVPDALWPAVFSLYTSISDRKWGRPYLTRAFFDLMPRHRAVVVLARQAGAVVAMTLSFEKGPHIYGRYWGCSEEIPGLHFELCYYRLLERSIANKGSLVEAGAQGEHKLKRGFLPVVTHSAHHITDPRFSAAVMLFLEEERAAVLEEQQLLLQHGPFKDGAAPDRPLVAGVPGL